jgi:glutamyl-tRNA reductase
MLQSMAPKERAYKSMHGALFSLVFLSILFSHIGVCSLKMASSSSTADLSNKTVGFLGCGKISSAVCRGYAGAEGTCRPMKIMVSKRSADKSAALQAEYPSLITVCDDNSEIVKQCDIIFIGLLPAVATEELPKLPFDE